MTSSPAAISGFIIAIIVYSINRFIPRTRAHVCIKILEIMPSFANFYASTSVMLKRCGFRIITTLKHPRPNHINVGSCQSMFWIPSLIPSTSTGLAVPISQTSALDNTLDATRTSTKPSRVFIEFVCRNDLNRGPIPKHISRFYRLIGASWKPSSLVTVLFHNLNYKLVLQV